MLFSLKAMKTSLHFKFVVIAMAIVSLELAPSSAMGAIQSSWQATSGLLPTQVSPPWTLNDNASPEDPVLGAQFLTLSTSEFSENMWYLLTEPAVDTSGSFYIEAIVRFVSGLASELSRAPIRIGFTSAPGVGNALNIGVDEVFFNTGDLTKGPSASVDTDGDFHTYRIEVTSTGSLSLLYDGVPTLTGSTFSHVGFNGLQERVFWGEQSVLAQGTSEWESFVVADLSAVPEPSMLLVFGGAMATAYSLAASRSQRRPGRRIAVRSLGSRRPSSSQRFLPLLLRGMFL
jgi:hypothetical protein